MKLAARLVFAAAILLLGITRADAYSGSIYAWVDCGNGPYSQVIAYGQAMGYGGLGIDSMDITLMGPGGEVQQSAGCGGWWSCSISANLPSEPDSWYYAQVCAWFNGDDGGYYGCGWGQCRTPPL